MGVKHLPVVLNVMPRSVKSIQRFLSLTDVWCLADINTCKSSKSSKSSWDWIGFIQQQKKRYIGQYSLVRSKTKIGPMLFSLAIFSQMAIWDNWLWNWCFLYKYLNLHLWLQSRNPYYTIIWWCGSCANTENENLITIETNSRPLQKHLPPGFKGHEFGTLPSPNSRTGQMPNLRVPGEKKRKKDLSWTCTWK